MTSRRSTRTTRRLLSATLLVFAAAITPARGGDTAPVGSPTTAAVATPVVPKGAWAVVDGKPITQADVDAYVGAGRIPAGVALQHVVEQAIVVPRLARDGVPVEKVTEKELEKQLDELKKLVGDLDRLLEMQGIPRDLFLKRTRVAIAIRKRAERDVTDAAVRAAFEKDKDRWSEPFREARARQVILATREDAAAVISSVAPDGSNVSALARTRSIDPEAALTGGDLDWFRRHGRVPDEVAKAVFDLGKRGLVPAPVRTARGWHVVWVVGLRETEDPFDASKTRVRDELLAVKMAELLEAWRVEANVGYAPDAPKAPGPGIPRPGR
jgi:parvulin-like peptidyl-prolyl isomerase